MATKTEAPSKPTEKNEILRQPAEVKYADQLEALRQNDPDKPPGPWKLSPRSVLAYVVGAKKPLKATINGESREVPITRKFFGDDSIVERSIVTLASERALLLVGEPGTGKSWLSEHLAAAICGCSTFTVQGTAGTTEEQIKYSWNIARVIAEGPKVENLIPSPCMVAMRLGALFRFEEITRCVGDVQDSLVSICSDKAIAVPELPDANMVFARPGFNIIATANSRDQGVNEFSAALKRRFNYVHIPIVADQKTEMEIVRDRSAELLARYQIPARIEEPVLKLLATVFRELRTGATADGVSVQKPSTTLSTAEAIGVALDSAIHSRYFGDGTVGPADVARNLVGSIVKEDLADLAVLKEYLSLVAKKRASGDASWKAFYDAALKAVQARADAVLAEPLYWFPVRHHSPGVARHLRNAVKERKPKVIFLEGPAEANDLIRHIVDAKTKPPVALYTSYRDDDNVLGLAGIESASVDIPARFSVWYPLLPYSPEYVVMKVAKELSIEVVFVDLPHPALIKSAAQRAGAVPRVAPEQEEIDGDEEDDAAEEEAEPESGRRTWEQLAVESDFYKTLAATAGYQSWGECWDTLFEVGGRHATHEELRRDLAYFCSAVRATTAPERIAADGTLERERHMWQAIQRELKARKLKPQDAMMVCGGFHLFMERDETTPPPPVPKGTIYSTVAPYSFFRTSELSGYGAGNRAPRYYQLLWERAEDAPETAPIEAMVEHVVGVLTRGRKGGEGLSSADAISVTQHARMLGTLRGRSSPALDDIRDALITCCIKGRPDEEGLHLLEAMQQVEVGTAVGRVTPELGRLPLLHDFYAQIDQLDLGEIMGKDKRLTLNLDLRDEAAARRSVFFHRLQQLAVPMAKLTDVSNDGASLFREQWKLEWSPKVEAELIERNLYGDSIEAAATSMLDEELAKEAGNAASTCDRLLRAVNMDLPGLVLRVEETASAAIDTDRRLASLAQALTHLLVLDRLAAHRRLRRDLIQDLIFRAFGRACFSIPEVIAVPEDEQEEVIHSLQSLAEALLGEKSEHLDRDLFLENVKHAYAASTVPYLRGAFTGLLTELRAQPAEVLAVQVSQFSRERPEVMVTAGEFLDGLLAVSKTSILLGADALLGAIDELLRAAAWEQFMTMLPRVRNAFERLHQRQRRALADRVAQRYGLQDAAVLTKLTTNVEVAAEMAAIDARVAEIMKEWSF